MWEKISLWILRFRTPILIGFILVTGFMGYLASKVKQSYEFSQLLPVTDPDFKDYVEFKSLFGEDGSVMFLGIAEPKIFELERFKLWFTIGDSIKKMDGIQDVVSLTRLYDIKKNDSLQKFEFEAICPTVPTSQAELDIIKSRIDNLPAYKGVFYSPDNNGTLMAITFKRSVLSTKQRVELVNAIKDLAKSYETKFGVRVHMSGMPFLRSAIAAKVLKEVKLFLALAFLVTALILLFFFRSWKAMLFPMLVVAAAVIWSFAFLVIFKYKITMLNGLIPPLLIIVGVPNSIFLLNKYQLEWARTKDKMLSLAKSLEKVGMTLFLANLTTAIGFGVFYFTNSNILIEFGTVSAVLVMVTFIISLIMIPIVFSYLPPPNDKNTAHQSNPTLNWGLNKINFWVHNRRTAIYSVVGVIIVISAIGMYKIHSVGYVVDDLPAKDPIVQDIRFFESTVKGVLPLEIAINTGKPNGVLDPIFLAKANRLQKVLAQYPCLSKPISLVDMAKFLNQSYHDGEKKYFILPSLNDLRDIGAYLQADKSKGKALKSMVDSTGAWARVSVQMADIGSKKMSELMNELRPRIDSIFPKDKYRVVVTGNSRIFLKGNDYLQKNLKESVLLSIVLIAILMSMLFMSARMIAIAILPSLIPLLITAGIMGYMGIALKPSTTLIFSIAFGIASDCTIYFLTKYRQELKNNQFSISKTITATIMETGVSMLYVAFILFFGFSIFGASEFGGTAALGVLVSITLLVAMASNLILLPCFLATLEKRLITKAFMSEPLMKVFDEDEDVELDQLTIKRDY